MEKCSPIGGKQPQLSWGKTISKWWVNPPSCHIFLFVGGCYTRWSPFSHPKFTKNICKASLDEGMRDVILPFLRHVKLFQQSLCCTYCWSQRHRKRQLFQWNWPSFEVRFNGPYRWSPMTDMLLKPHSSGSAEMQMSSQGCKKLFSPLMHMLGFVWWQADGWAIFMWTCLLRMGQSLPLGCIHPKNCQDLYTDMTQYIYIAL